MNYQLLKDWKWVKLGEVYYTISGADTTLTSFDKTVDKNFQNWIFKK